MIQRSAENTSEDTNMKPLSKMGRLKTYNEYSKSAMDTHQKYESFTYVQVKSNVKAKDIVRLLP